MPALLIADHDNVALKLSTAAALTAARQLDDIVDVLVAGNDCMAVAEEAAKLEGVRTVLLAQSPRLAQESPEALSALAAREGKDYTHVIFAASSVGKAAMPRTAALLDVSPVSEIQAVKGPKTFVRGMYAGSLLATVELSDPIIVATVRTTSFAPAPLGGAAAEIEEILPEEAPEDSTFVKFTETKSDRPELVSAKIVVAGGRGLIDEAGFKAMEDFADSIGAAVGATRTAVDMGLCPNDWQIGQTGKMVAPQLYIGLGISGAIQHTAGIKDAKVVVAINKDPEAPIFEVADYGLVMDAQEACRELKDKLGR